MLYFVLKGRMGNNEVNLFSPFTRELYTLLSSQGRKKIIFCFVLPFKEKFVSVSLAVSFGKESTSLYPIHPTNLLDLDSNSIGCTKHHYYLLM